MGGLVYARFPHRKTKTPQNKSKSAVRIIRYYPVPMGSRATVDIPFQEMLSTVFCLTISFAFAVAYFGALLGFFKEGHIG